MMNKMNEMMSKMDSDMKKQGMDMMNQCKTMMDEMEPKMKEQCQSMMNRCKSMMGESGDKDSQNVEDEKAEQSLIFTHKATSTFEEIEKRVEGDAKEIGLGLKKVYPFSKNLPEQQGFEINEAASVYELCMPSLAAELLNTQPELNVLMPCRISLYEKEGEVFISTPDLTVQLEALGCKDELKSNILDLYVKMVEMIERW